MKRLNNIKWFSMGMAVCLIISIFIVPALAASFVKTADLHYNNIGIKLNGQTIIPKDGNGKAVDPFIIDGTTYLPVRAVSSALGLEVGWDTATDTVLLTGATGSDNSPWSNYNNAYPFLFLHASADLLESTYGTISEYRNLVYIMYGRITSVPVSASEYANYTNTVASGMNTIYNVLVSNLNYVDSLEGSYNNAEFQRLQRKTQVGYENLFYSFFSLEAMVQAVKDCWSGKPGSTAIIEEGDRSVGEYLSIALSNIDSARDGSLDYLINSLPDN